jgi:two-component system CheB/CheR fusion protein
MVREPSETDLDEALREQGDTRSRDTLAQVPVVGIGASAGGLEAMKEFLAATPTDTGACFVFVQHLDPGHKSMLTELLGRCTEMPVHHAEDGIEIAPNRHTARQHAPDSKGRAAS